MNIIERIRNKLFPKTGVYQYKDYGEYEAVQIQTNIDKLDVTWVNKDNILMLSDYIKKNIPTVRFGLCHGTRRGNEQAWFREALGCDVIGTEISPTATRFPHTIQWDFNKVKEEWIGKVDFIYSNSFDHAFNPEQTLDAWMSCVQPDGLCILEWTIGHISPSKEDPFGATLSGYKKLIKNKYKIAEILRGYKVGSRRDKDTFYFIIKHRK